MSGGLRGAFERGVGGWEESFLEHMRLQSHPEHDPYAYAHDQAFLEYYAANAGFREMITGIVPSFENRPDQAAFKLQKSAQAIEIWNIEKAIEKMKEDEQAGQEVQETDRRRADFPRGYDDVDTWLAAYERLCDDEVAQSLYISNLIWPIASNVSERGKLFKVAALLNGRSEPTRMLDVGCSLNLNPRRLACHDPDTPEGRALDYQETEIYVRDKHGQPQPDPERTEIFNYLANARRLELGPSLGVDIFDPERDKPHVAWAESNSFRMPELLDPVIHGVFKRLKEARPENVGFRRVDAALPSSKESIPERFDMVMISTMLYLLREDERQVAMDNAEHWVDSKGLIAILDFVDISANNHMSFYPKKDWPWNYKLWVKDESRRGTGFNHYFTAADGRANKVILEPAIGELAAAQELGLAPAV